MPSLILTGAATSRATSAALFPSGGTPFVPGPPIAEPTIYNRPDDVSSYNRPGGIDTYYRP